MGKKKSRRSRHLHHAIRIARVAAPLYLPPRRSLPPSPAAASIPTLTGELGGV